MKHQLPFRWRTIVLLLISFVLYTLFIVAITWNASRIFYVNRKPKALEIVFDKASHDSSMKNRFQVVELIGDMHIDVFLSFTPGNSKRYIWDIKAGNENNKLQDIDYIFLIDIFKDASPANMPFDFEPSGVITIRNTQDGKPMYKIFICANYLVVSDSNERKFYLFDGPTFEMYVQKYGTPTSGHPDFKS